MARNPETTRFARLAAATALCAAACLSSASVCHGQAFDARSMAMGGVKLSTDRGAIARINPAYRAVPRPSIEPPLSIPLPLGLVQAIQDFPTLDVDDEDFNLVELINYAVNIPYTLQIGRPEVPTNDIGVFVAQDRVILDLGDAQETIPDDAFEFGGIGRLLEVGFDLNLGADKAGVIHLGFLEGFTHNALEFDLDDQLRPVLQDAEPILGGQTYGVFGDGIVQGGVTSGLAYAREVSFGTPSPTARPDAAAQGEDEDWAEDYWQQQDARPRLFFGVGWRHYFGLGYARFEGDMSLEGEEPLLEDADSFEVDYDALYSRAHPEGFGTVGHGNALDIGAVMLVRNWELGFGVADIGADLTWGNSDIDRYTLVEDPEGNQIASREAVGRGVETKTNIPVSWLANANYRTNKWLLAGDIRGGPGGSAAHAGAEYWAAPVLALRGGFELDQRGLIQGGLGVGIRLAKIGWDLGLRTHSNTLNGERVGALGLSLVLY